MRIVELKPQNAKIIYKPVNESLKVGEFVSFTEGKLTLIAQVYRVLSSDAADDFNQADMTFLLTEKYGKVTPWQGELVSAEATVSKTPKHIIDTFICKNKNDSRFIIGCSPFFDNQYDAMCFENFSTPAFIGYERSEDNINLTKNICKNIAALGKKSVILDFKGNLDIPNSTKIIAGVNAKLPLNQKMIENLCPKMLEGVSLESKVVIEDILIELAQYAQESSDGFIPISNLINVIDDFYKKSKMTPLILLKNKLRHYERLNIFANEYKEACSVYKTLEEENNTVILDVSNIPINWQNEFFNNLIEAESKYDKDFYLFITIDNLNFDNNILNYLLFKAESIGIKPIISANYRHLSFDSIYDFSRNMFLFKTYNTLKKRQILSDIIQTLPSGCFIVNGQLSKDLLLLENLIPVDTNAVDVLYENTQAEVTEHIAQEQIYPQSQQAEEHEELETLEELTDYSEENNLQNIDIGMMNGALEPEPNISIKNPSDLINSAINPEIMQAASEITTENLPEEEIVDLVENELTEEHTPDSEPVAEQVIEIVQPPQVEEPEQVEQIQQSQEQITDISTPEPQIEEIQPDLQEEEPEMIIDESSLDEPVEEIPVDDNQIEESEILDLVEETEVQDINSDDELFEEVASDDSLENIDLDDLDFLNENAPQQDTPVDNDDDLLDLVGDEQLPGADDDFGIEDTPEEEPVNVPQQESLPVYDANYGQSEKKQKIDLKEGDLVKHNKFGVGTITKITTHGDKVLCFINFDNLGRKLLDPELSQLEKID